MLVAVVVFAAATAYLFVFPEDDALPPRADAIVVLAGGRGHRLDEGLRLWRSGVARVLAISDGTDPAWAEAYRLCRRPRVRCFKPDPYSTRGEARWTARQGWDAVVVVTSTYHVRRARELFHRCFEGRLAVVEAEPPVENFAIGVAWEWPKTAYYLAVARGC